MRQEFNIQSTKELNMISLCEPLFYNIQGEGPNAGKPSVFIRTSRCFMRCNFCFGVKGGSRLPRFITPGNGKIKLNEVKIGDKLLTYNDDIELVETEVIEVFSRSVTEWYEIKIENKKYFVTPEHPFFTTRGLIQASDLKQDDYILHSSPNDKRSYNMKKNNPMKNPDTCKVVHEKIDIVSQGNNIRKLIKDKKENGTYIHSFDKLTDFEKVEMIKKCSESKLGELNPNWKGGSKYPIWEEFKKKCSTGELSICEICENELKLEVHHIDKNHENDTRENLLCICHKCHSKIHERGYNFWLSERNDKKFATTLIRANGFQVQSIKRVDITENKHYGRPYGPKPLNVINVKCSPYNTYFIDYMWVHNCDTKYSWYENKVDINFKTLEEIVDYCKSNSDNVVITGGEPLMHYEDNLFKELIYSLQREEINISIETTFLTSPKDIKFNIFDTYKKLMESWGMRAVKNILFITSPKIDLECYKNKEFGDVTYDELFDYYSLFNTYKECDNIHYKIIYNDKLKNEIIRFVNTIPKQMYNRVYMMPYTKIPYENNEYLESCKSTVEFCKIYKLNYSPRLQIDIWGVDRKGV